MMKKTKENKAFTLIELIVVIAVIGVLVLLAAPKFLGYTKDAKLAQIKNDVRAHEDFIVAQLATDDEYTASWTSIEASELENIKGELLDKFGYVKNEYELTDDYFEIPSKLVNTKLKGDFYYAKGGQVYYYETGLGNQENNEPEFLSKSINLKDRDSEIEHTITLENLSDVKNISVNNGDIEIVEIDGNDVTFKVSNGEVSGDGERTKENIEFKTDFILENLRIYANDLLVDEGSVLQKDDELFRYEDAELTREYTGGPSEYEKIEVKRINERYQHNYYEGGKWSSQQAGGGGLFNIHRAMRSKSNDTKYSATLRALLLGEFKSLDYSNYNTLINEYLLTGKGFSENAQSKIAISKGKDKADINDEIYIGDLVRNFNPYVSINSIREIKTFDHNDEGNNLNFTVLGGKLQDFIEQDWIEGVYTTQGLPEIDQFVRNLSDSGAVNIYVYDQQAEAEILVFEDGMGSAEWTYTGTATKVNEYYDYNIEIEYTEAD